MMRNKIIFTFMTFLLLLVIVGVHALYAGDASRIGTAAGTQLQVPVGARDLGMGGADLATTHGLDAIYWNPAGLAKMKFRASAVFSTMKMFNDVNVNYFGVGAGAGRFGSIGVTLKTMTFGDIPVTTNEDWDGTSGQVYSPTFFTLGLTYSRLLTEAILIGVTGKLISESIPRASASSLAFDIGLQYYNLGQIEGLNFGIVVRNIGTNMKYSGPALLERTVDDLGRVYYKDRPTVSNQLPAAVELGVSYKRSLNEQNDVTIAGLFQNNNFENDAFKFGAEYMFNNLFFLRGGYLLTSNTDSKDLLYTFTAGAGIYYKFGGTNLMFDYCFRNSQYFDGNNLFSLTLGF
jgi:hypothetical protein